MGNALSMAVCNVGMSCPDCAGFGCRWTGRLDGSQFCWPRGVNVSGVWDLVVGPFDGVKCPGGGGGEGGGVDEKGDRGWIVGVGAIVCIVVGIGLICFCWSSIRNRVGNWSVTRLPFLSSGGTTLARRLQASRGKNIYSTVGPVAVPVANLIDLDGPPTATPAGAGTSRPRVARPVGPPPAPPMAPNPRVAPTSRASRIPVATPRRSLGQSGTRPVATPRNSVRSTRGQPPSRYSP